jgi:hypothetical protein
MQENVHFEKFYIINDPINFGRSHFSLHWFSQISASLKFQILPNMGERVDKPQIFCQLSIYFFSYLI